MTAPLHLISSMATRRLLAALTAAQAAPVTLEAAGGVDVARRITEGESFDVVVLASDAIARLQAGGHLRPDGIRPLVDSRVAIAVRAGAPQPDIRTEAALRSSVLAARRIAYSTGPSGSALLQLFERWGLTAALEGRLIQARPGVPVSQLVAQGEAELGFQQASEFMDEPGITVLGGMPAGIDIVSRFSGAVAARCSRPDAAQALLDFMASPANRPLIERHGLQAVND